MEDNYIRIMRRNENDYAEYMSRADEIFRKNGDKPSKEECIQLQMAAMCQSAMADISMGEEQRYHQRCLKDVNKRIASILKALDPEGYKEKMETKRSTPSSDNSKSNPSSSAPAAAASSSDGIDDEMVARWKKEKPAHSFEDVAGMEPVKTQLKGCIADAKLFKLRDYLELPNLHSYFFIGPPGCGKTYIIEAFAHELMEKEYTFLSLTGSDILSKYVGEAEKIVTRLFEEAEKRPTIIFIDEIDGVCKNRSLPNLPEYASSITTAFLTGYNRINSSNKQIIFIGATNYPNQVDAAMLDRVELIRIPMPDKAARAASFKRKFGKKIQLAEDFSFEMMGELTDSGQYNQRDINRLTGKVKDLVMKKLLAAYPNEDDAINALKSGEFRLTRAMFEEAQKEYIPSPKDDILNDLDAWEERFRKGMEE